MMQAGIDCRTTPVCPGASWPVPAWAAVVDDCTVAARAGPIQAVSSTRGAVRAIQVRNAVRREILGLASSFTVGLLRICDGARSTGGAGDGLRQPARSPLPSTLLTMTS